MRVHDPLEIQRKPQLVSATKRVPGEKNIKGRVESGHASRHSESNSKPNWHPALLCCKSWAALMPPGVPGNMPPMPIGAPRLFSMLAIAAMLFMPYGDGAPPTVKHTTSSRWQIENTSQRFIKRHFQLIT